MVGGVSNDGDSEITRSYYHQKKARGDVVVVELEWEKPAQTL